MKLKEAIERLQHLHDKYGNVDLKLYETLYNHDESGNLLFQVVDFECYVIKVEDAH